MLLVVILDNKYQKRVPVEIGTLVIDHLVATMTFEDLQQAGVTWKNLHLSTVFWKRNTVKSLNVPEYDLKEVKGKICMMREVVIPPFTTTVVKGIAKVMTHSECMNVVIEQIMAIQTTLPQLILWWLEARSRQDKCLFKKSLCKANHSSKVDCCGRNCSGKCHCNSAGTKANRG